MISLGFQQLNDPYYQGMAAQISFYLMLSLVPMVILISQALGAILGTTLQDALGWVFENAQGSVATLLKGMLTYKSGGATNIAYVLLALWAASRAQFSMMRINNYMNTEGYSTGKGYFSERIRAVFNIILTLVAIIVALVFMAYGGKMFELITDNSEVWLILRWPLALILFMMVIGVYYYTLPEKKVKFREIIPGTIFAAFGILIVTAGYSIYTSSIADYDIIYGASATIVALMMWFFFLSWVFCLGMLVNKVWRDTKS